MIIRAALAAALALLAAPFAAEAQPAVKIPRIGFLSPSFPSDSRNTRRLGAFQQGLRELGYVEVRTSPLSPDGRRVSTIGFPVSRPSWSV
jgi:hypothetical protein